MDERARSFFYFEKKNVQTGKENRRKKGQGTGHNSPRVLVQVSVKGSACGWGQAPRFLRQGTGLMGENRRGAREDGGNCQTASQRRRQGRRVSAPRLSLSGRFIRPEVTLQEVGKHPHSISQHFGPLTDNSSPCTLACLYSAGHTLNKQTPK